MALLRISVYSSRELQGLIARLRTVDRETRKAIRQATKGPALSIWQESLSAHASTQLERRVLSVTGRVRVSDQNVTLTAATVGRKLSHGLNPKTDWHAVEFGADREARTKYTATRNGGRSFEVTRRTKRQFKRPNRKGYVVYPAAADAIPRLAALWVQTAVRTLHELIEGK
jgi:hypothetical protein